MALVAVYLACSATTGLLAAGEKATLMVVAAIGSRRVQVLGVRGILARAGSRQLVDNETADAHELAGDVVIEVITASHAVRGTRLARLLLDELAFLPREDSLDAGWDHRGDGLRWRRSWTAC